MMNVLNGFNVPGLNLDGVSSLDIGVNLQDLTDGLYDASDFSDMLEQRLGDMAGLLGTVASSDGPLSLDNLAS